MESKEPIIRSYGLETVRETLETLRRFHRRLYHQNYFNPSEWIRTDEIVVKPARDPGRFEIGVRVSVKGSPHIGDVQHIDRARFALISEDRHQKSVRRYSPPRLHSTPDSVPPPSGLSPLVLNGFPGLTPSAASGPVPVEHPYVVDFAEVEKKVAESVFNVSEDKRRRLFVVGEWANEAPRPPVITPAAAVTARDQKTCRTCQHYDRNSAYYDNVGHCKEPGCVEVNHGRPVNTRADTPACPVYQDVSAPGFTQVDNPEEWRGRPEKCQEFKTRDPA